MTLLRPSRRDMMKMTAAAPAFALATPASAKLSAPSTTQSPGFFRFSVGDAQLTVVSDGHFFNAAPSLGVNADEAEVAYFLEAHFLDTQQNYAHANHVVIELGDAKVIVDVGSGDRFQPTTGRMLANLAAAGIGADTITHVVLTHAHPDHIWGIRDDFDEAIFPDAEYIIGAIEYDWWTKDNRVNEVEPAMQQLVLGAVNSLAAVETHLTMAQDGHEVAPGLRMVSTPGHTPGHMSLMVESSDQSLLVLGDAISHAYVSFERPNWFTGFDMDGPKAVTTRARLLDMATQDRTAVLGYHFPFPGVGHVMESEGAYRFIPALWKWEG